METLKKYWWVITVSVAVAGFAFWLYTIEAKASNAEQKADKLEVVAEETKELAKQTTALLTQMTKPDYALRNHLILYGIDSAQAANWTKMSIGVPLDSGGAPLHYVPYLDFNALPDVGIMKMWSDTGPTFMKELWNFNKE